MFFRKKVNVKKIEDNRLLDDISEIQDRANNMQKLVDNSLEVSDETRIKLKLEMVKYQFLYLEARRRNAKARETTNIIFGEEDTFLSQPNDAEKHW
ncbi:YaaL family protein [Companilactobacillus zhongbaensis]|uniref:YaaL family protein n=1 Tax=Companilactobacillus zhongbaensis TaxID=2486009 RepID=UPI000F765EDB|nr:YaaL family protein [Companilactobacillus zhongbaensis]